MRCLVVFLLAGCAGCNPVPPSEFDGMTPEDCRMYGVAVHDNDTPTGKVVVSECATYGKVEKKCGEIYGHLLQGCARAVEGPAFPSPSGQYEVYYADCGAFGETPCNAYHEACHAIYEQKGHTVAFNLRKRQGDKFAACPQ